jgi:hypothetical protein
VATVTTLFDFAALPQNQTKQIDFHAAAVCPDPVEWGERAPGVASINATM